MAGHRHDQNVDGDNDELALGLGDSRISEIRDAKIDAEAAQLPNVQCAERYLGNDGEQIAHDEHAECDRCAEDGFEKGLLNAIVVRHSRYGAVEEGGVAFRLGDKICWRVDERADNEQ